MDSKFTALIIFLGSAFSFAAELPKTIPMKPSKEQILQAVAGDDRQKFYFTQIFDLDPMGEDAESDFASTIKKAGDAAVDIEYIQTSGKNEVWLFAVISEAIGVSGAGTKCQYIVAFKKGEKEGAQFADGLQICHGGRTDKEVLFRERASDGTPFLDIVTQSSDVPASHVWYELGDAGFKKLSIKPKATRKMRGSFQACS